MTVPNTTPITHLLKLTDNECTLLMDNYGCLKWHHVFTYHFLKDCPNDWLNATTYHPIIVNNITTATAVVTILTDSLLS